MDYIGHPYYVSGNAILNALVQNLDTDTARSLKASHGMFVPGQFGTFPENHSQSGSQPYLGAGLPAVETYDDLFLHREPDQGWLLDSRARDALNIHGLRVDGGHPTLAHQTIIGRPPEHQRQKLTTRWYIHAYLHADNPSTLPVSEESLGMVQFGAKRNYGYGEATLKATQTVDLDALDFTRLDEAETHLIRLVTPFVTSSGYPGANDVPVPWWWDESRDGLRFREEKIVDSGTVHRLETVDHGQVVEYAGDCPVETARNGLTRVGSHSRLGFGELRVIPLTESEAGS